jgi:hypothetical protein
VYRCRRNDHTTFQPRCRSQACRTTGRVRPLPRPGERRLLREPERPPRRQGLDRQVLGHRTTRSSPTSTQVHGTCLPGCVLDPFRYPRHRLARHPRRFASCMLRQARGLASSSEARPRVFLQRLSWCCLAVALRRAFTHGGVGLVNPYLPSPLRTDSEGSGARSRRRSRSRPRASGSATSRCRGLGETRSVAKPMGVLGQQAGTPRLVTSAFRLNLSFALSRERLSSRGKPTVFGTVRKQERDPRLGDACQ